MSEPVLLTAVIFGLAFGLALFGLFGPFHDDDDYS